MPLNPLVVDISHHNTVLDFARVKAAGIVGIIHKADEGLIMIDKTYDTRRANALKAGLLWGAYHFNTGDVIATQVEHFVKAAKPDKDTLMCLDFEDNRRSQMSVAQAVEFMARLTDTLGRKPIIYSGNRVKDLAPRGNAELAKYKLWLCQYGPRAVLPAGWSKYFLWQYTGDGIGMQPHSIDGIADRGLDINHYDGTPEQLAAEWAS